VTIDHQSLEDETVTLRDRDSLAQDRIAIADLGDEIERRLRAPWTSPKIPFADDDTDAAAAADH
jgi:glycyl-tRNA synthetase